MVPPLLFVTLIGLYFCHESVKVGKDGMVAIVNRADYAAAG